VAVLPSRLRRSLTWDQGVEMSRHDEFTRASDVAVYFCERGSPWQRGTNENTNGLLRQYFPKGTDLRVYTAAQLASVAAELNARPRKILGWETPSQQLDRLLA
jgi:IS30 family transposase